MSDFFTSEKFIRFTEKTVEGILGGIGKRLNDGPGFVPAGFDQTARFYAGSGGFLGAPAENACWRLGYASVDLTPYDYYKHDYFLGGYLTGANGFNNRVESIVDKMMCRIAALDDGSGRGLTLFATVDCIGLGNRHIKLIRRKLADNMKYAGIEEKIAGVNVFSTHAHSCVDTQGLWTDTFKSIRHNYKKNRTGRGTYRGGADEEFMRALTEKVAAGMLAAVRDLTPGALSFAEKDIGAEYFSNRNRKSATALNTVLTRFIFTPADKNRRPTLIASFPAHPDVAGLPTTDGQGSGRELCGEYIYYMGELVEQAGFNFLFVNGAICAIYMSRGASNDGVSFDHRWEQSVRYGRELARIALSLTKTEAEIEADPVIFNEAEIKADMAESAANGAPYTLWYENWEPVEEIQLPPLLNLRLAQVKIPVTNPLIILVGKLDLVAYDVIAEGGGNYSICTELGYMELGGRVKIALAPGEFCQDLWLGGESLTAAGSFNKTDFPCPPLTQIFGEDVRVFGLANDAIGYIVPDNDYILGEFRNHYHELISLGEQTGSTVMEGFVELKRSL